MSFNIDNINLSEDEKRILAQRAAAFRNELRNLTSRMMSNDGIGTGPTIPIYKQELEFIEAVGTNTLTVNVLFDEWMGNILHNFFEHYYGKPTMEDPKKNYKVRNSAICVGSGPSLNEKQLKILGKYRGTVFACNKVLERLVKFRVPEFGCMIHGSDANILLPHFDNPAVIDAMEHSDMKLIMATATPKVVSDFIMKHMAPERVFWFNSSMPNEFMENIDLMNNLYTKIPVIDTGGNVGLFTLIMAWELGARAVGLLGMEHCMELDKKWTNKQVIGEYSIHYFPEQGQTFAMTPVFRGYLMCMKNFIEKTTTVKFSNLTPKGMMYCLPDVYKIPYLPLWEFARNE